MANEKIYQKHMESLKAKMIQAYNDSGLRASGRFEEGLEVKIDANKLTLFGAAHSEFMEFGRRAGTWPPKKEIEDWIDNKAGLPAIFQEKKDQFVFLIRRKIGQEGTQSPTPTNPGNIISSTLENWIDKDLNEMIEELSLEFHDSIQSDILNLIKSAA